MAEATKCEPVEEVQRGSLLVVVKPQESQGRGRVWRVIVFVNGVKMIRPGFQKRKAALSLAGMMVQQSLIHGWVVVWQVFDEDGRLTDMNLAALGSKMQRGEKKQQQQQQKETP